MRELKLTRMAKGLAFALETAASGAHHGIVRFLFRKGVDVNMNMRRFGSALHGAAASVDITISCGLLDHGANPKALGGDHVMVLEAAEHVGHVDMVRLLLEPGAEPEVRGTPDEALSPQRQQRYNPANATYQR